MPMVQVQSLQARLFHGVRLSAGVWRGTFLSTGGMMPIRATRHARKVPKERYRSIRTQKYLDECALDTYCECVMA